MAEEHLSHEPLEQKAHSAVLVSFQVRCKEPGASQHGLRGPTHALWLYPSPNQHRAQQPSAHTGKGKLMKVSLGHSSSMGPLCLWKTGFVEVAQKTQLRGAGKETGDSGAWQGDGRDRGSKSTPHSRCDLTVWPAEHQPWEQVTVTASLPSRES